MKLKIFIIQILLLSLTLCFAEENIKYFKISGIEKKYSDRLCGVWVKNIEKSKYIEKFSWGYSYFDPNLYIEIDFSREKQFLDSNSGLMRLEIKSGKITKKNNLVLELSTDRLNDDKNKLEIIFIDKNTIEIKSKTSFLQSGVFYKSGGPDLIFDKYYYSTVDKLRLRKQPTLKGESIGFLMKGDKVVVLDSSNELIDINGVKGKWVEVETEQGEIGWCFDAYLKPYDEVKKK